MAEAARLAVRPDKGSRHGDDVDGQLAPAAAPLAGGALTAASPAIAGIGIVNATEVVHAFQGMEGLQDFRAWVQAPDAAVSELIGKATGGLAGGRVLHWVDALDLLPTWHRRLPLPCARRVPVWRRGPPSH